MLAGKVAAASYLFAVYYSIRFPLQLVVLKAVPIHGILFYST
jgi:hypothetical protein